MTKAEIIKRMENLPDDTYIHFALFTTNRNGDYVWKLLNPTLQQDKQPADVIGLATTPIMYDEIAEISTLK